MSSNLSISTENETKSYDLTPQLLPHMDRHLVLPLLNFLEAREKYSSEEVLKARIELLKDTNLIAYVMDMKRELQGLAKDASFAGDEDFKAREIQVQQDLEKLNVQAEKVMKVLSDPQVVATLRQDKSHNLTYLKDTHQVTVEQINTLYDLGILQYSVGQYSAASDYLYHFRVLSTDSDKVLSSQWGKLAANILEGSFETAFEELGSLRELIEQRSSGSGGIGSGPALVALQQRSWWLHWSLFVYFNHPEGREGLLESWMSQNYLNTIQTSCPWLLRYLVASAVITKKSTMRSNTAGNTARSREIVREIVRALSQEAYQYSDPITEFLRKLYGDIDFEGARLELEKAVEVMADDFFLEGFKDEFLNNARYLIAEAYCRIHQRIDIADLSKRLGLSGEEGEKWIVDLVRDSRLDAKIDFKTNTVQMNHQDTPVYQAVIDKTKGILFRVQAMSTALDNRVGGGVDARNKSGRVGRSGVRPNKEGSAPVAVDA